jgi:short-subunit dehydrogenase
VPTEFGQRAGFEPEHAMPGFLVVEARDVAHQAIQAMVDGRRSVVPGAGNKLSGLLGRYTPRTLLLPLVKRQAEGRIGTP